MAITTKGRRTRQRIIVSAAEHLRRDDAAGVRLDDILAATRTSKGQLFHYFPEGKSELLLAVAHYEAERTLADQEPFLSDLSDWSAWSAWRDAVVARYRAQGRECPLGALMSQVQSTPGSDEVIASLLGRWHARIAAGVVRMRDTGKVRADINPDAMASTFLAVIQGGVAILRSTGDATHLERGFDTVLGDLRRSPAATH